MQVQDGPPRPLAPLAGGAGQAVLLVARHLVFLSFFFHLGSLQWKKYSPAPVLPAHENAITDDFDL